MEDTMNFSLHVNSERLHMLWSVDYLWEDPPWPFTTVADQYETYMSTWSEPSTAPTDVIRDIEPGDGVTTAFIRGYNSSWRWYGGDDFGSVWCCNSADPDLEGLYYYTANTRYRLRPEGDWFSSRTPMFVDWTPRGGHAFWW